MSDGIAVINGGSSSIKFSLYRVVNDRKLALCFRGQIEGIGTQPQFVAKTPEGTIMAKRRWDNRSDMDHRRLIGFLIEWFRQSVRDVQVRAVGHRVVHGGSRYRRPVQIDDNILTALDSFVPLAPLHQPHNLLPIRIIAELNPDLPQVACFDTAFHATNPPVAQLFALPRALTAEGIRRYGFHGLSYEYIARKLPEHDPKAAQGRTVVAHLGSGASMCALQGGQSVATTMGFSAVDGLPMGTRTGALDPGVILYLLQEKGMEAKAIEQLLYKASGLLGVSGISNDMRVLLQSQAPEAGEAIDLFVYRIQRELGALTAVLGGLDGLVFTAGIGEHAPAIRTRICKDLAWLGIELDAGANDRGGPRISRPESRVSVWVIPTNEEVMIATHTRDILVHQA